MKSSRTADSTVRTEDFRPEAEAGREKSMAVVASALGTDPFLSLVSADDRPFVLDRESAADRGADTSIASAVRPRASGATIESDLKRLEERIAAAQAAAAF